MCECKTVSDWLWLRRGHLVRPANNTTLSRVINELCRHYKIWIDTTQVREDHAEFDLFWSNSLKQNGDMLSVGQSGRKSVICKWGVITVTSAAARPRSRCAVAASRSTTNNTTSLITLSIRRRLELSTLGFVSGKNIYFLCWFSRVSVNW